MLGKGLGNLGNLSNMLKQAMEVKGKMEEMKESLANERVEAEIGAGQVQVVMSGGFEVLALKIDPEIIDKEDPEMLESMVRAGVNAGVAKVRELVQDKLKEVTGGMDIPGLTS